MFEVFVFDRRIDIETNEVKQGKFFEDSELILETQNLKHNIDVLGYNIIEKDKRKINLKFTKRLGIPQGPLLGKLQNGKGITWKGKKIDVNKATKLVKGKKVTIISDTMPCKGAEKLANNSDLLICEATYSSDLEEKAAKHRHMTTKQAADLAKKCNVKKLILTHFSARYKDFKKIEKDAKNSFNNVLCSEDFMKIDL